MHVRSAPTGSATALLLQPGREREVDLVGGQLPFDDPGGHPRQTFIVVSRVGAKSPEGLVHVTVRRLAYHALRLFNDDSTVESVAQLFVERSRVQRRLVLKNRNSGYVGESLGSGHVGDAQWALVRSKEIERTNRSPAKSHRKAVYRAETVGQCARRKVRPPFIVLGQVVVDDGLPTSIAVHTRSFVRLYLKELKHPHRLTRRRDELQFTPRRSQHHPGRVNVDGFDAAIAEDGEHVDHVVIINKIGNYSGLSDSRHEGITLKQTS